MASIKVRVGSHWLTVSGGGGTSGDLKTEIDKAKNEILEQVDSLLEEVNGSVNELEEYLETAFKDGLISYAEKAKIESYLNLLSVSYTSLEAKYQQLISDPDLPEDRQETLLATHTNYVAKYDLLVQAIKSAIEDNNITSGESNAVDSAFEAFENAMTLLTTQLEQSAKDIYNSRLSTTKSEINSNISNISNTLNQSITSLQSDMSTLESYVKNAIEDGVISEAEKMSLESYLNALSNSHTALRAEYETIVSSAYLTLEQKADLTQSYNTYDTAHNTLDSTIRNAMGDGQITEEENTDINNAFDAYELALYDIVSALKTANRHVTSGEIKEASNTLNESINNVQGSVDDLQSYVNGSFKDGIITESEKIALNRYMDALSTTHTQLLAEYAQILTSVYLTTAQRTSLTTAHDSYVSTYEALITMINSAIEDGKISELENEQSQQVFTNYENALTAFVKALKVANGESVSGEIANNITNVNDSISRLQESLDNLDDYVNNAFKDSVISQAESNTIASYINMLRTVNTSLEAEYNSLKNNQYLSETDKTNLTNSNATYTEKLDALIQTIQDAIVDGSITNDESIYVNNAFDEYQLALDDYTAQLKYCASKASSSEIDTSIGDLRTSFNEIIADLNSDISNLEDYVNTSFNDGLVTKIELQRLEMYMELLSADQVSVYNQYTALLNDEYLPTEDKTTLQSVYTQYNSGYSNLMNLINTAITDQNITEDEKTQVANAFAIYKERLASLVTEMQRISSVLTASRLNLAIGNLTTEINSSIEAVQGSVSDLEDYVNGSFKDGLINDTEASNIGSLKRALNINNSTLEAKYNSVVSSDYLPTAQETELRNAHDAYTPKYTALITAIDNAIADGKVTSSELTAVNNAFNEYNTALNTYVTKLEQASAYIYAQLVAEAEKNANKYTDEELAITNAWVGKVESNVSQLENEIAQRVTQVELNEYWLSHQGIDNSYVTVAKDGMKADVTAYENATKTLKDYLDSAGSDGILYDIEITNLNTYIQNLKNAYSTLKTRHELISGADELATTTEKTILDDTFTEFTNVYNELLSLIQSSIADQSLTESEKTAINSSMATHDYMKDLLDASMETAIEKIAKVRAISSTSEVNEYKNTIVKSMETNIASARDLVTTMTTFIANAFSNGVLTTDEKNAIIGYQNDLDILYNEVVTTAEELLANEYLEQNNERILLTSRLSSLKTEYSTLMTKINDAISNNTFTTTVSNQIKAQGVVVNATLTNIERAINLAVTAVCNAKVNGILDVSEYYSELKKQEAIEYADELKVGIDASIDEAKGIAEATTDALQQFKDSSSIQSLGQTQLQAYLTALANVKSSFDVIYNEILANTGTPLEGYEDFEADYTEVVTAISNLLSEGTLLDLSTFNTIDAMLEEFKVSIDTVVDLLLANSEHIETVSSVASTVKLLNEAGKLLAVNVIADYTDYSIGAIYEDTGLFTTSGNDVVTGYIEIEPKRNYLFNVGTTGSLLKVIFYDENKNFISSSTSNESTYQKYITSPSNAKYARITAYYSDGTKTMSYFRAYTVPDTQNAYNYLGDWLISEGGKGKLASSDVEPINSAMSDYTSMSSSYIKEIDMLYPNEFNFYTNSMQLKDNNVTHIINSENSVTTTVVGTWARLSFYMKGLESSTRYRIRADVTNNSLLKCGLYSHTTHSDDFPATETKNDIKTDKKFTSTIDLLTDTNGGLTAQLYANDSDDANENSVVTFSNISVTKVTDDFILNRDGITQRYELLSNNIPVSNKKYTLSEFETYRGYIDLMKGQLENLEELATLGMQNYYDKALVTTQNIATTTTENITSSLGYFETLKTELEKVIEAGKGNEESLGTIYGNLFVDKETAISNAINSYESALSDVNNRLEIPIECRNMQPWTDFSKSSSNSKWTITSSSYGKLTMLNGWACIESIETGGNVSFRQKTSSYGTETLVPGETYTLSFEAYATSDTTLNYCYVISSVGSYSLSSIFSPKVTTEAKTYSVTWTVSSSAELYTNIGIQIGYGSSNNTEVGRKVYVRRIKLEHNNKSTGWREAPSDVKARIQSDANNVNTAYSSFSTAISAYNSSKTLSNLNSVNNALTTLITRFTTLKTDVSNEWTALISEMTSVYNKKQSDALEYSSISMANFTNYPGDDSATINSLEGNVVNATCKESYDGLGWAVSSLGVAPSTEYILKFKIRKIDGTLINVGGYHNTNSFPTFQLMYFDGKDISNKGLDMQNSYTDTSLDDGLWHTFECKVVTSSKLTTTNKVIIQPNRGKAVLINFELKDIVFEPATLGTTNFVNYSNRLLTALDKMKQAWIKVFNNVCVSDVSVANGYIENLENSIIKIETFVNKLFQDKYITEENVTEMYEALLTFKSSCVTFLDDAKSVIQDTVVLESEITNVTTNRDTVHKKQEDMASAVQTAINGIKASIQAIMKGLSAQLNEVKENFNENIVDTIKSLASFLDSSIKLRTELAKLNGFLVAYELEQTDLTARYNQIYYNSYLSSATKSEMTETKNLLDMTYNTVMELINNALDNNSIDDYELYGIENAMSDYKVQVGNMSKLLEKCVDEISQNKIDGIYVGTRNLIHNSTFNNGLWNETGWKLVEDNFTNSAIAEQRGLLEDNRLQMTSNKFIVYPTDEYFTFSLNFKVYDFDAWDSIRGLFTITFYGGDENSETVQYKTVSLEDVGIAKLVNNQWYRLSYTCKLGDTDTLTVKNDKLVTRGAMSVHLYRNGKIEVKECKAERSSIPSEWSPAPEDDYSAILALAGRVTDAEQLITDDAIINLVTQSDEFNFAFEGKVTVDDLKNYITSSEAQNQFDAINNRFNALDYVSPAQMESRLTQTASDITAKFSNAGGVNLIKNSVGYDGTEFWTITKGKPETVQGILELEQRGAGSAFRLNGSVTMKQDFYHWLGAYTISVVVKKGDSGTGYFKVTDEDGTTKTISIESRVYDYERLDIVFESSSTLSATIEISSTNSDIMFTSIMAHFGDVPLQWTHATGEVYNDNIIMNRNGLKVVSSSYEGYTTMTPKEFAGYATFMNEDTGVVEEQKVFCLNRETTEVNKLKVENSILLHPVKIVKLNTDSHKGIAFISSLDDIK